jgi:hypothetical protein
MAKLRVDKIAAPIIKDEYTGSVHFDGAGDYLSIPDNSDFTLGSNDFTIEAWVYFIEHTDYASIIHKYGGTSSNSTWFFSLDGAAQPNPDRVRFWIYYGSNSYLNLNGESITYNTWNHVAAVRHNNKVTLYQNGVATASSALSETAIDSTANVTIGGDYVGNYPMNGYVSNARICKGHAVYTGNFTVPTRELEVHTGAKGVVFPAADNRTVLLACQSSTDATAEATGRHTITANGNAHAQSANPGLLRKTNITSTITETTGSVFFDGTDDRIDIAHSTDFRIADSNTFECWIYYNSLPGNNLFLGVESSYWVGYNHTGVGGASDKFVFTIYNGSSWQAVSSSTTPVVGTWYHLAAVKDGASLKMFINGILENTTIMSGTAAAVTDFFNIGKWNQASAGQGVNGYLSNVRVCKGHAVYTSNFIPPTKELEVHGGPDDDRTVLLCCYDAENIFADKTGRHVLAAYGDRTSSPTPTATDSPIGITTNYPPVTREVDPTAGPTFGGGAGFVSQNWLTLPKGTTTERMPVLGGVNANSARGVFGGGYSTSDIEYIQISTLGNSSEFGDRAHANLGRPASLSSSTRGLFAGGFTPNTYSNTIDYITITSTGNGKDFGDMSIAVWSRAGCSNSIRGIIAGGSDGSNSNIIEHLIISSTGNGQDFGDLTRARRELGGSSSTTRGIFMGGRSPVPSGQDNNENIIDYITIATTGNAVDFGDLTLGARTAGASCSNATRSLYSGGNSSNTIEFVTIATLGNSTNFGDMNNALNRLGSCASSTRGIIAGGSPTNNTIEYVTIASAGDATNFGDLSAGAKRDIAGLSNGHGGLG